VPYDKWLGGVYLIFGMTQKLRLGFVHKRNLTLSEINQVAKGSDESFFFIINFPRNLYVYLPPGNLAVEMIEIINWLRD